MNLSFRLFASRLGAIFAGAVLASAGAATLNDPIMRAFWDVACVVMLLVLAWEGRSSCAAARVSPQHDVDWLSYTLACSAVLIVTVLGAGTGAAIVVASIAFSLLGMLLLLTWFGLPVTLSIAILLLQSVLFLTWPIWSSSLLVLFDCQRVIDLLVKIGPLFAINGSIDPTDAFTHRPLAYRLMNLGQDVPYEMPRSIWPCVLVHVASGLPGILLRILPSRRNAASTGPLAPAIGGEG